MNDVPVISIGDCRLPVEQAVFSGANDDQNSGPVTPMYPNFLTSTVLPSSRGWRKVLCEQSDQTGVTDAAAASINDLNSLAMISTRGKM